MWTKFVKQIGVIIYLMNPLKGNDTTDLWIGYCAFHVGDYKRALLEYEAVSKKSKPPKEVNICLACTYFYLGMYQEAEKAGDKAEKDRLSTRVRFHLSHKFGDEKKLMTFHQGKSYA